MLKKVISGGQTGVDRAALDAAIKLNIPHGGWCPKGRTAIDGIVPKKYKLQETDSSLYPPRTRKNVEDADGTLVYADGEYSRGTELTIKIAKGWGRPLLVIDNFVSTPIKTAQDWVTINKIKILNVAGPSDRGRHEGIYGKSYQFLLELFSVCSESKISEKEGGK